MSPKTKPTIILVHGAWHPPTLYSTFVSQLSSEGYKVHAPRLPSLDSSSTDPSISADVATIRSTILSAADAGEEVILVMHSYGGIPGSEACRSLDAPSRTAQNQPGGVVKLVYLCAYALPAGQSLIDHHKNVPHGDDSRPTPVGRNPDDEGQMITLVPERFYTGVDVATIEWCKARLEPQAAGSFGGKVTFEAWKEIESVYLICENDEMMNLGPQEGFVAQEGGKWTVVRCGEGHSPFLSKPQFVADVVRMAAGEYVQPVP